MYAPAMFCHSIFSDNEIKSEPFSFGPPILPPEPLGDFIDPDDTSPIAKEDIPNEIPAEKKSKQQICKVCGKTLSSASSYYVHLKKHSGSKPYQCSMCDATFCRKPYLEVHMRVHTGERPFECDICKKRFTQKSSLNTHKRSHSGLRPFACNICFKRFSVKSYLIAHQWSHAASGGILCNICQVSFTNKSQYLQHMNTHTVRNFECADCKKAFVKEAYLIRHKNRMHRDNKIGQNAEMKAI
ncbi:hypothetical protein NQ317_015711 [Molorchus minor]|uniref:C2H2-type domain-containing protein n=1 Tax=Molorchus minor TaxID=1323400 RepID=A0ABQ9JP29_9CUCU|nr:hypothetical protein NQ317_015711 [Molorchus minor]